MLFQPFRDFEGVNINNTQFARNLERSRRQFDLMRHLGTSRILVCSNTSPDRRPGKALRKRCDSQR